MTIDTSREAVERIARDHQKVGDNPDLYAMGHPHHWKTAQVLTALLVERDAALADVARLSTPPDDAEMRLFRDRVTAIEPLLEVDFDTQRDVERDPYGAREAIETALYLIRDQADALTRLSHALAAETAKREAMEEALRPMAAMADRYDPEDDYGDLECWSSYAIPRIKHLRAARAALAKHGSKT